MNSRKRRKGYTDLAYDKLLSLLHFLLKVAEQNIVYYTDIDYEKNIDSKTDINYETDIDYTRIYFQWRKEEEKHILYIETDLMYLTKIIYRKKIKAKTLTSDSAKEEYIRYALLKLINGLGILQKTKAIDESDRKDMYGEPIKREKHKNSLWFLNLELDYGKCSIKSNLNKFNELWKEKAYEKDVCTGTPRPTSEPKDLREATKELLRIEKRRKYKYKTVINLDINIDNKELRLLVRESCNKVYQEIGIDSVISKLLNNNFAAYVLLYIKNKSTGKDIPISIAIKDPYLNNEYKINQIIGQKVHEEEVVDNLNNSEISNNSFGQWMILDSSLGSYGYYCAAIIVELHENKTDFEAKDYVLEYNGDEDKPLVNVLQIPGQCQENDVLSQKERPFIDSIGNKVVEEDPHEERSFRRALINMSKNIGEKNESNTKPGYFGQKLTIKEILFIPILTCDNFKMNFLIMPEKKQIPSDLSSILIFRKCVELLYAELSEYLSLNYQEIKD